MGKKVKKQKQKQKKGFKKENNSIQEIRFDLYDALESESIPDFEHMTLFLKKFKDLSVEKIFDCNFIRFHSKLINGKRVAFKNPEEFMSDENYVDKYFNRPHLEKNIFNTLCYKSPFIKLYKDFCFIIPLPYPWLEEIDEKYKDEIKIQSFFQQRKDHGNTQSLAIDTIDSVEQLFATYFESLLTDQRNKTNMKFNDEEFQGMSIKEMENIINNPYRSRTFYNTIYLTANYFIHKDINFLSEYYDKDITKIFDYVITFMMKSFADNMLNKTNVIFKEYQKTFRDFYKENHKILKERYDTFTWCPFNEIVNHSDDLMVTISILLSNDIPEVKKYLQKCMVSVQKENPVVKKKITSISKISSMIKNISTAKDVPEISKLKECTYASEAILKDREEITGHPLLSNSKINKQNLKVTDLNNFEVMDSLAGDKNPYLLGPIRIRSLLDAYNALSYEYQDVFEMNMNVFTYQMIYDTLDPMTYAQTLYLLYSSSVDFIKTLYINKKYEIFSDDYISATDCASVYLERKSKELLKVKKIQEDDIKNSYLQQNLTTPCDLDKLYDNVVNTNPYNYALEGFVEKNKYNGNILTHIIECLDNLYDVIEQALDHETLLSELDEKYRDFDTLTQNDLWELFSNDHFIEQMKNISFVELLDYSCQLSDINIFSSEFKNIDDLTRTNSGFTVFLETLCDINGYELNSILSNANNPNMKSFVIAFDKMMKEYVDSDTNIFIDSYNIVMTFGYVILCLLENDKYAHQIKKTSIDIDYEEQILNFRSQLESKDKENETLSNENSFLKSKLAELKMETSRTIEKETLKVQKQLDKKYYDELTELKKQVELLEKEKVDLEKNNSSLKSNLFMMQKYVEENNIQDEETEIEDSVSISAQEKLIEISKKYHISWIGGHDNLKKKVIVTFPDIHVCKETINQSDCSYTSNADFVFFLTQHMSHNEYEKIQNICFSKDIPFFYIKGNNLELLSNQILEHIETAKK